MEDFIEQEWRFTSGINAKKTVKANGEIQNPFKWPQFHVRPKQERGIVDYYLIW